MILYNRVRAAGFNMTQCLSTGSNEIVHAQSLLVLAALQQNNPHAYMPASSPQASSRYGINSKPPLLAFAAKTCFQTPPDQTNQALGWSCPINATSSTQLGHSCSANCAVNSTGPGYTAVCSNDADFWPGMNGTVNATTGQVANGSVVPRPSIVFGTWRVTGLCQCKWISYPCTALA
jgi:hypothetical protein